tara:strand:- start:8 stop:694 length:687 start_codon:yes stop_codon:yes gene_type:complete
MKLAALFTGGKDSTYAIYLAQKAGHEITCLITMQSENQDSYMFHTPTIELTELQAEAMESPHIIGNTAGEKEKELVDLKELIIAAKSKFNFEGIVTGAVESVYQATRVQKICNELKLWCFNPLWLKNQEKLMKELLHNEFEFILTGVAADGMNKEWLNKIISMKELEKLKELNRKIGFQISFEGGEAESFVLNCPLFKRRIKITKSQKVMENYCTGKLIVKEAILINK